MNYLHSVKLKIYIVVFLLVMIYCCYFFSIHVFADNGNTIVHVTKTGYCYHREGCGHLRSDIEITLHDAVVVYGYIPCEDCEPPIYDGPEATCTPMDKPDGGNYSGGASSNVHNTVSNRNENTSELSDNNNSKYTTLIVVCIVAFWPIFMVLCEFGSFVNKKKQEEKNLKMQQEKYEEERRKYYDLYAGKNPINLVEKPQGAYIFDGLPCTNGNEYKPYGDYTVYVATKSPRVFHINPQCGGAQLKPLNYCFAQNLNHCRKCATGRIQLPTIEWYFKYMEIKKIKERYNIP